MKPATPARVLSALFGAWFLFTLSPASAEPKPAKPTLLSRLIQMEEIPRNTLHLHPGSGEDAAWLLEVLTRWNEGRL